MNLECLDHVHFAVPDLATAKGLYGPFLRGHFVEDYGGPELNAYGGWNTSGGDFIQPIDPEKSVFGGPPMPRHGLLSVSFRVADVDRGIEEAQAHGLVVRSRVGSEDIGLGKNVIQAQLDPEPVSGLPFELVEHQLPDVVAPLTESAVDHVELGVSDLDAAAEALGSIFESEFAPAIEDAARAVRTRRHRRLGLLLSSPARDATSQDVGSWQSGLSTIAFHCSDLEAATAEAREAGLTVAREGDGEIDFEAWAGVALRLVERAG